MSIYSISVDSYASIAKIDDKYTSFLLEVVSKWDDLIENIYKCDELEIKKIYEDLKSYKRDKLSNKIGLLTNTIQLTRHKYYLENEQYIAIASASDAYTEKGIAYLQLLRSIKAHANYEGIGSSTLFDKLNYWENAPSKKENIKKAWKEASEWKEENVERLKTHLWENLGGNYEANKGGKRLRQFIEKNIQKLGGRVEDTKWIFTDEIKSHPSDIDNSMLNEQSIESIASLSLSDISPRDDENILAFAQGDTQSGLQIFHSGRSLSQEELNVAKQKAEYNGQLGEKLVNGYLETCKKQRAIISYDWASQKNATSPYDFKLTDNSEIDSLLDVKSTSGDFASRIYISEREIITMAKSQERYDLYRVYGLNETGGMLRIARGMRGFAQSILDSLDQLPPGVHVDSFSVEPKQIESYFDEPMQLLFSNSYIKNS